MLASVSLLKISFIMSGISVFLQHDFFLCRYDNFLAIKYLLCRSHAILISIVVVVDFDYEYIGVDFALKVINWDPDTLIRLQLWDIAGKITFSGFII